MNNYNVGLYIRLSKEDEKNGESESITNQKSLLLRYVRENNYNFYDYYIDDGYSGTNFDRLGFKRMLKDIELGKINMVITKDMSRLGRDYIETGKYIEKYFPANNIRYIALTDNVDTYLDGANNDLAPFKAIMNDYYAKDISKKIKTALRAKQQDGKWVGGCPPLGYMIDPKDKNHLIINKDESYIILLIFDLALKGNSIYQIKEYLNNKKIKTSTMIRGSRGKSNLASLGIWNTKTISNILKNRIYTGDLVQNKRNKVNYKIKKIIYNKESDWIIVPNTHDAIISKDKFMEVNKIIKKMDRAKNHDKRLLDGLLYCFECKHKISICKPRGDKTYLVCNNYRMNSKNHVCTSHSFNYDNMELEIIKIIKKELEKININYKNDNQKEIKKIEYEIIKKKNYLDKMYLDKLDNNIDTEMYDRINKSLNLEIKDLESNILKLKNIDKDDLITRDLIIRLIDKIEIHQDKTIDIYFNFCNHQE